MIVVDGCLILASIGMAMAFVASDQHKQLFNVSLSAKKPVGWLTLLKIDEDEDDTDWIDAEVVEIGTQLSLFMEDA